MKTTLNIKILGSVVILLFLISCTNKHNEEQLGRAKGYPVLAVKLESTKLFKDYSATLKGQQTVEIRSKITGYIEKILVEEGAYVKRGQLLFRLNDNDLRATVRSYEAQVKVAEADVNTAKINLNETKPLVEKNIVSKFNLESAESALKAKESQLAQAKANLENAKANLQYTLITSPADGTIGTFPYRVGSLVSSTNTEPLTIVSNTRKMYAYFSLNEKEFLNLTQGLKGKNIQEKLARLPEVSLIMADNTIYQKSGRIETASGLVDQQSGAVTMRATFTNLEGVLLSGGSGSVRIPQYINSAIIIPQKAAFELQDKYFVYVVGQDNKVRDTEIKVLVGNLKDSYVVTDGLKAGDKIVLEGIASLRAGVKITPKLVEVGNLSENTSSVNQVKN
jgi:membrane fusion protein (multidrug efflux system)